jgi:Ala-tRNA(Pro) deacylase
MSVSRKLEEYLDMAGVPYEHHVHPTTFTATQTAACMHIPAEEMAKTVIVKADGRLLLAVMAADQKLDVPHLQFMTRAANIDLATEQDFANAFPECELGAMPPFGIMFGMPTYCDTSLQENDSIEFNAGSHDDSIRMTFDDFKRLSHPVIIDLVQHPVA